MINWRRLKEIWREGNRVKLAIGLTNRTLNEDKMRPPFKLKKCNLENFSKDNSISRGKNRYITETSRFVNFNRPNSLMGGGFYLFLPGFILRGKSAENNNNELKP